jgi:signal peptidase II
MSAGIREKIILPPAMIFIIVFSVLLLDQSAKALASKNILLGQTIPVINNIFHLTLVHNRGAAFGIFKNQTVLFVVTSLVAIIIIGYKLKTRRTGRLDIFVVSLVLILAGALGNLIDRLFLGYVVDFLDFRIWPVFNIADSAITIGAVLLGLSILKSQD